jgi:hypothetical protein
MAEGISYCFECKRPLVEIRQSRPASSWLQDLQLLVIGRGRQAVKLLVETCRHFSNWGGQSKGADRQDK